MKETIRTEVISKFLQFLAEKKLLQKFVDNTLKSLGQVRGLEDLFGRNPYYWVMDAFTWSETTGGAKRWLEVNKAWRCLVEHNNWNEGKYV